MALRVGVRLSGFVRCHTQDGGDEQEQAEQHGTQPNQFEVRKGAEHRRPGEALVPFPRDREHDRGGCEQKEPEPLKQHGELDSRRTAEKRNPDDQSERELEVVLEW